MWQLAAPSYEPLTEDGGDLVARGDFTFDMSALANLAGIPQTYFVHAFSGEHAALPVATALVTVPDE